MLCFIFLIKDRFFDDVVQDAHARQVDFAALDAQASAAEWTTFQAFIKEVKTEEKEEAKGNADMEEEKKAREEMENMKYVNRYRQLLEKVITRKTSGKIQDKDTDDGNKEDKPKASKALMTQLMMARKRKRQIEEENEEDDKEDDVQKSK